MFGTPEILIVSSQHYFENDTGNPVCIFCQSPKASFWRIFMRFAFPPPLVEAFAGSRQSMYRGESDPRGPGLLYSTPSPIPGIPLYHRTHHALTYPWTTNANIFFILFISDNMCFWAKAWNTATLCQCSLFNETRHCTSAVPTNSCSVPTNISLCTMGKDWSGEGEGPGEEGLRWYPVLPTPAAKQDTDNPSFIYEGSLCPPSKL